MDPRLAKTPGNLEGAIIELDDIDKQIEELRNSQEKVKRKVLSALIETGSIHPGLLDWAKVKNMILRRR